MIKSLCNCLIMSIRNVTRTRLSRLIGAARKGLRCGILSAVNWIQALYDSTKYIYGKISGISELQMQSQMRSEIPQVTFKLKCLL